MHELERPRARSRVVLIETAGRRSTGSRPELEASTLIVDGRRVVADVDPTAWWSALVAAEHAHHARRGHRQPSTVNGPPTEKGAPLAP